MATLRQLLLALVFVFGAGSAKADNTTNGIWKPDDC